VGIALGPSDWRWVYVLDSQARIFRSTDAGLSWYELTGNLPGLTGDLRAIEVFTPGSPVSDEVIFVAGYGGVYVCQNPRTGKFAFWQKHGNALPNAVVTGLHYSAADDVLVAGTLGRGAFSLKKVTDTVIGGPKLRISSSQQGSCLGGWGAGSTITFSAVIVDGQYLTGPLTYEWDAQGAANQMQAVPWQLIVKMPDAGNDVDIHLTVTDATGFKLHAVLSQVTVAQDVAIWRAAFCQLIHKIETTAILNWPINPLGPPIQSGDGPLTRAHIAEAIVVVRELGEVLEHLVRVDDRPVGSLPSIRGRERRIEEWRRAYPIYKHADKIVSLRVKEDVSRAE